MSKVFISHKNNDVDLAREVAARVRENGLQVYLDSIDTALLKDGSELADYLLNKMSECQQLIAVVSLSTANSWWVPWEIGVGSEKGLRMASYTENHVALPTYLKKWPGLHSGEDIDLYCKYSKEAERSISYMHRGVIQETARMKVQKSEASAFHKNLSAASSSRRR